MAADSDAEAMRSDWNQRAREDANYYVAFGRRNQSDDEFLASASDEVRLFETELKRRPVDFWKSAEALEIGCGPGRLLRPLSRHFGRLHGVDISDEMLRRARERLDDFPNVTLHHAADSTLSQFADETIDFIFSYAVFQHIPDREVVLGYLRDSIRILRPGGLFVFQINGLPDSGSAPTTWEGCRVRSEEIRDFAGSNGLLLLSLTDRDTQYMWVTLQKPFAQYEEEIPDEATIFKVTNAYSGEPFVPVRGRFGAASILVTHLPERADLLTLSARINGANADCCYLSPPTNGRRFVNVIMPPGTRTGLVPVDLAWRGRPLGPTALARIVPPAPKIASVSYIADGINLLSIGRVDSGSVRLVMDEVTDPSQLGISMGGSKLPYGWFCVNPLHERYEFNFKLPPNIPEGLNFVHLTAGGRSFAPIQLEVGKRSVPKA